MMFLGFGDEQRDGTSPLQKQTINFSGSGGVKFVNELQQSAVEAFSSLDSGLFLLTVSASNRL